MKLEVTYPTNRSSNGILKRRCGPCSLVELGLRVAAGQRGRPSGCEVGHFKKEDLKQYLDALEGLSSQGCPDEPLTTRRYEILQRFMTGVSDPVLQLQLTVVYATEAYLTDPSSVESLRFTVNKLQRRRHQEQACDPG